MELDDMPVDHRGKDRATAPQGPATKHDCKPYLEEQVGDGVASKNRYQHRHQGRGQIAIRVIDRICVVLQIAQTKGNQATGCCHSNLAQPAHASHALRILSAGIESTQACMLLAICHDSLRLEPPTNQK